MKTAAPRFMLLLLCAVLSSTAQNVQLKLYDNVVTVFDLYKAKDASIGFVVMKPVKMKKGETPFGFWLSNESKAPFLNITDGTTGKSVLTVSGKQFAAKAKINNSATQSTVTYKTGNGKNSFEIVLQAKEKSNNAMPLAKEIECSIRVNTQAVANPALTINIYGDGSLSSVGTKGITVAKTEKNSAVGPNILLTAEGDTKASVESSAKGGIATLSGGQEIQFSITGSTVADVQKSFAQVGNIEKMLSTKEEKTELAVFNEADKSNPLPGDTVTFTIVYHNIGTAPARDIAISNPIPERMKYVENSAQGDDTQIAISRKDATAPQQGEVESITWTIKKLISPGEMGKVSMKAIVQ